jgi:hypothetical protein
LRRCGVAALRRCGVAALRRCGVAALRPHCPIAGSIVCSPSSVCKAWPCGPPPLAAAGLTDRWREAARSAHAINAGMSMTAPMTRLSSPAPRPPPESRSRGIIQVGLATPTSLRPKRAPLRGRSMTFWKIRCRRQPSAPTHMPAKKCGFRPAFTYAARIVVAVVRRWTAPRRSVASQDQRRRHLAITHTHSRNEVLQDTHRPPER